MARQTNGKAKGLLTPAQFDLFLSMRNRTKNGEPRYRAYQINTMTLASLQRKGAIELKGKTNVVHETALGSEMYDFTMNHEYMAWKAQLEQARRVQRLM